jgi:hypothetical protein
MHGLYPGVQRTRAPADRSVNLAESAVPVALPPMIATVAVSRMTLLASLLVVMVHHPSLLGSMYDRWRPERSRENPPFALVIPHSLRGSDEEAGTNTIATSRESLLNTQLSEDFRNFLPCRL